jgi:putative intracellular protease/amidase
MVAPPAEPALPRVVVVLPHEAFWYPDWQPVRDTLAGKAKVTVASSDIGKARGTDEQGNRYEQEVDLGLADARVEQLDAVVFVGGLIPNEFIGNKPDATIAHRFVVAMLRAGRHVGTLCQGTQVLAETSDLPKIRAAHSTFVPPEVMNHNTAIQWEGAPVVVSGHVVTGRDWHFGKEFTLKLLQVLEHSRRDQTQK